MLLQKLHLTKLDKEGIFLKSYNKYYKLFKNKKRNEFRITNLEVNFVRTNLNKHEYEDFVNFWKDKARLYRHSRSN